MLCQSCGREATPETVDQFEETPGGRLSLFVCKPGHGCAAQAECPHLNVTMTWTLSGGQLMRPAGMTGRAQCDVCGEIFETRDIPAEAVVRSHHTSPRAG